MTTFSERISAALDTVDPLEAGDRVHQVVAAAIQDLDTDARVVRTGYFNHSYVPDMVVSWKDRGGLGERPVFLRHSLRSSRASGDLEELAEPSGKAFFLSLAQESKQDREALKKRPAGDKRSRAAVSTVGAISALSSTNDDPVMGMVRSSVVRSARGVLTDRQAERLVLPEPATLEPGDVEAFDKRVRRSFTEDAAVRIGRVTQIVQQALLVDPDQAPALVLSGHLSRSEIRELVPYLLGLEGASQNDAFWDALAGLMSLDEIEQLWGDLAGLDVTPLVRAGSSVWTATRAQISLREVDEGEDDDTPLTSRWRVRRRRLAADVGPWTVDVAHKGTKIKTVGRQQPPARWEVLRPALKTYTVTGANLAGIQTTGAYDARESVDMKERIDSFIALAGDSFHVPSVDVVVGRGDDAAVVHANFGEMLCTASPEALVGDLVRVAVEVLGHSRTSGVQGLADLFREGPQAAKAAADAGSEYSEPVIGD